MKARVKTYSNYEFLRALLYDWIFFTLTVGEYAYH